MATITSTSWEYLSEYLYICTETSRIIYYFVSNSQNIVNFIKYNIDFSIFFIGQRGHRFGTLRNLILKFQYQIESNTSLDTMTFHNNLLFTMSPLAIKLRHQQPRNSFHLIQLFSWNPILVAGY